MPSRKSSQFPTFGESAHDMGHRDFGYSDYGPGSRGSESYRNTDLGEEMRDRRDRDMEARGHFGKGPKGWKRSDERIREEVNEMLMRDRHVDASDIEVSVKDGLVILKGTVLDRQMKREAELCIEDIHGVSDVRNELTFGKRDSSALS